MKPVNLGCIFVGSLGQRFARNRSVGSGGDASDPRKIPPGRVMWLDVDGSRAMIRGINHIIVHSLCALAAAYFG